MTSPESQLELLAPQVGNGAASASVEEAAAILVALALFVRDTTPTSAEAAGRPASEWLRIARLEAVARAPGVPATWGNGAPR